MRSMVEGAPACAERGAAPFRRAIARHLPPYASLREKGADCGSRGYCALPAFSALASSYHQIVGKPVEYFGKLSAWLKRSQRATRSLRRL